MSELASPPSGAATPTPAVDEPLLSAEAPTLPATPSPTTAGTLLAGRYRLRTRVGSDTAAGAEFWRAEDTVLQRDVAITVLRRLTPETGALGGDEDPTGASRAGEMMVRALRSGAFEHSGCARLLDVLNPGAPGVPADVLGAAVTEWVPGRSLAEIVADGLIRPLAVARAIAPLAAAAALAHRHGLVLGCDHPQRVRITPEGRAQLSFALPRPDIAPADDVRGLGAVVHTLLTSRWPLSGADAARAGLAAAERGPDGAPTPPSAQRPGVPVELDTIVYGTLGPDGHPGHVHTAAAVHRMLREVVSEDDRIALFPPVHDGVPSDPGDVWQDGGRAAVDPRRRRNLRIGLAALALAVLVVLGYIGVQVGALFSDGSGPRIRVDGTVAPSGASSAGTGQAEGGIAAVAGVKVYDKVGDRDDSAHVARVIDGNPDSTWHTSTYRQQFPALKPGVGVMVSFASAVRLASLEIDSPSAGTVVQVRSAPTDDAAFADTSPITDITLGDGTTPVSLAGSQPVTHVLLWIGRLGGGGSEFLSQIGEVEFRRAAG